MKITNLTKLIIRFLGGGKIDFPTNNLREVEIEPFDGEGGETMDFKTYCDTIIRNYLIDSNIDVEDVVMPDIYIQFIGEGDEFTTNGDYLKPYLPIIPLYNNTLVIDESKKYINGETDLITGILNENILVPGSSAKKNDSFDLVENYCTVIARVG